MYIADEEGLRDLAVSLGRGPFVCVDTEFMRERTYYARLCLIQVSNDDLTAIVDPLSLERLDPLLDVLADKSIVKVMHAASQDLEIFYRLMGQVPAPVFDTQIAATLAGMPQQVGYGALVKDLTGESLDKSDTYTDWAKRPLSGTQIEYAMNDVRYLPAIYQRLRDQLESEGRLTWVEADFARLEDPSTYEAVPREMWRRVKRHSSLNRRALGVLREIAAWREEEAQHRDVPRKWILNDESLIEIARRAPASRQELEAIRGVSDKLATRLYPAVLGAVKAGLDVPDEDLPKIKRRERRYAPEGAVDLMAALVRHRAKEHKVAVPLLASRDELERLAGGERDESPLLTGWRRRIVGEELLELLEGKLAVKIANGGICLLPLDE